MNKYKQWKKAIKSPPPERLAKIEYQSHFFQMLGISIVCIMLIFKGFWYIIFAFVFGLGISYSQGMNAYIKYNNIMALLHPEQARDYQKDISPTRRRSKIINHIFGNSAKWMSILGAVLLSFVILGLDSSRLVLSLVYPLLIMLFYAGFYFFVLYWIAYPIYKRDVKIE